MTTRWRGSAAVIKFLALADKVEARFAHFGPNTPQTLKALEAFARVLRTRIQLGFRMSRDPWGAPWAPLNPVLTRTGQPLLNTRRFYSSIQVRRTGNGITVGTNMRTPTGGHSLGAIHNFGATIEPKNGKFLAWSPAGAKGMVFAQSVTIPARPFMPIRPNGQVDLPESWAKSALQAMARAFEVPA